MNRRWVIWGALICTLAACWWVERDEQASPLAVTHEQPLIQRRVTLAQAMPALTAGAQAPSLSAPPSASAASTGGEGVNLFSAMPMPAAEMAAAQVQAPVNPYTYAGRLQEEGRWVVFLTDGQQQYVLHEGDQFAEGWQVAVLDQQKVVLQHAAERFEIRLEDGVVF